MDFENMKEIAKDIWVMLLDHWVISLIIGSIVLAPVAPAWILVFGLSKLVQVSRQKHRDRDD